MRRNIRRFSNDVASWWLKVHDDIRWAEVNLANDLYNETCFVAQQIAEKALKCYLLSQGIIVPKIHKLLPLLKKCVSLDKTFLKFRPIVKILDQYYITTRYPPFGSPEGDYTRKEADDVFISSKEIAEFVKKNIGK